MKIDIGYQKSYPNVTEVRREWDIIYDAWQEVMNRLQADRDAAEIADLRARGFHVTNINGSQIIIKGRNPNVNIIQKNNVTSFRNTTLRLSETVTTRTTHISSVSIGLSVGIPVLVCILIFFIIKKFKPKMSHFRLSQ